MDFVSATLTAAPNIRLSKILAQGANSNVHNYFRTLWACTLLQALECCSLTTLPSIAYFLKHYHYVYIYIYIYIYECILVVLLETFEKKNPIVRVRQQKKCKNCSLHNSAFMESFKILKTGEFSSGQKLAIDLATFLKAE